MARQLQIRSRRDRGRGTQGRRTPGYKPEQITDEHFSLERLLPEIVSEVRRFGTAHDTHIPVIAAGGIYTGEDIYRIMELGADGVQMGTRFVTTEECDASTEFKRSYIEASQQDIEIIQSPVGMPGRAIHNSFLERVKQGLKQPKSCPFNCIKTCDVTHSPYCIIMLSTTPSKATCRQDTLSPASMPGEPKRSRA